MTETERAEWNAAVDALTDEPSLENRRRVEELKTFHLDQLHRQLMLDGKYQERTH